MPYYGVISRRALIRALLDAWFDGPYRGKGDHPEYMEKGDLTLTLPNRHSGDIGI